MKNRLLTLLIILSMLSTMAPPVAFAENEIHIATAKDLETLAKNCILDSYSKDLTVILDADIDLTGKVQPSIPIFSGIFDGAGHTISGFELALDGYDLGLFRIIASGGYIMNLNVEGYVDPENVRDNIGGIAGSNYGVLENCTFKGNVHGNMHVGGLVGYNYGAIINCTNYATLLGKTNTGGIAGSNEGLILGSTNEGEINTTYETVEASLDNISLLELTSITGVSATDENVVSNTGGIVGASVGVIRSCVNKSQVGYQPMATMSEA
ncbi:MAG: hypothetical protein KBS79_05475 [Lachnospiraceae bacterium]|nr:hypothetical protein [Candidatus Minthocola equi]